MNLPNIISALGAGGLGVAGMALLTLALKIVAWRLAVRDRREYAARLLAATTDQQRTLLEENPPPQLPDQILKVLMIALVGGLAAGATEPAYRVAVAMRTPTPAVEPDVSSHASPTLTNPAIPSAFAGETAPASGPVSKACSGDRPREACRCVEGEWQCPAAEPAHRKVPPPKKDPKAAQASTKPITAETPPDWQDSTVLAFPDRAPDTYEVGGATFYR